MVQRLDLRLAHHHIRVGLAEVVRRSLWESFNLSELHRTHACRTLAARLGSFWDSYLLATWHFLNLSPILQVLNVVLVQVLFVDNGLSVKEPFRKRVVLSLDSLRLLLAHD